MSIQQAMNSMLFSAQVGAGLYAHSPAGQKQAKLQNLETQEKKLNKTLAIETEAAELDETLTGPIEKVYYEGTKKLENLARERYGLDPSEKGYKNLLDRISEKQYAKQAWEDRKKILKENKRGGKK